ncbi:RnfH family protein [Rudaea sp.]|uniref:RnfH family protein n=1 Tax=Rudaea sp. TaxID=2136325 RepID=UPI002ED34E32
MPLPEASPATSPSTTIRVEVVYAELQRQIVRVATLPPGATVGEAIRLSGIRDALPADFEPTSIGIFGRMVVPAALLSDGDRVELYRPLKIDPKQARRRRAEKQKRPGTAAS